MFSKMLIATDLSAASDKLTSCIGNMKNLGTTDAVLFHALRIKHLDYLKIGLARDAEPFLLKQKAMLESAGLKTSVEIGPGETVYELNHAAKSKDVSLVVIGTHGKSLLTHALLGGEATKILHYHQKPILVVRIKITDGKESTACEAHCLEQTGRIMYATDFSDTAQLAFSYVEKIVESGYKKVTLIHVQDKAKIEKHMKDRLPEFNTIDDERLHMLADALHKKGAKDVDIVIPYGNPVQEIIKATKNDAFSLIVMGSQGRGFVHEIFLGSVSHNVVRQSDIPVLLIPALR
jgi:nucleotide-binding universal stress UspA family protein